MLIGVHAEQMENILEWLLSKDLICNSYQTNDAIRCFGSIKDVEHVFSAHFESYQCVFTGRRTLRSENFILPRELQNIVEMVHGISDFSPLCKLQLTKHSYNNNF